MSRNIEPEIIKKAIEGDAQAFSEIYFRLRGAVYGFCFRMTNDESVAEDITQEVFMFLVENSSKYDAGRGQLLSFLCGVARNMIFRHLRRRGNFQEMTELDEDEIGAEDFADCGDSPLDSLLKQELAGKVGESIADLPLNQREVIILRELHDFSYQEIAEITETNVGTIKIWLYRARKTLARKIAPYLTVSEEKIL